MPRNVEDGLVRRDRRFLVAGHRPDTDGAFKVAERRLQPERGGYGELVWQLKCQFERAVPTGGDVELLDRRDSVRPPAGRPGPFMHNDRNRALQVVVDRQRGDIRRAPQQARVQGDRDQTRTDNPRLCG